LSARNGGWRAPAGLVSIASAAGALSIERLDLDNGRAMIVADPE